MKLERISGALLTRNWMVNIIGQGLPLVFGLFTIPYLLRYLEVERFGILSIAWALLGYLGQIDLGLGRATTKFVAECLGRGETSRLPGVVWTALLSQLVFGVLAALLLIGLTPLLANRMLKVSPALMGETKSILFILALSLPLIVATNCLRGVLEAAQQFTVVNCIKIPANVSVFVLPVMAVPFGIGLPGIVFLLVLSRFLATMAYLVCCCWFFPGLKSTFEFDSKALRPLFIYGGWVTVSNLVGPLLVYVDRFFIASMVSVAAVGFYTAPYELVTKVWLLPASLLSTLFPAFTTLRAGGLQDRMEELYVRSLKSLLLVSGAVLVIIAVFARQILNAWLGPEFAARGASTLQILAFGMLINCIAYVPFGLLQGLGRPDLTAKFHLLEVPFYGVALWLLLRWIGLPGAALAWTLRVAADTLLLFIAVWKLRLISVRALADRTLRKAMAALCALAALLGVVSVGTEAVITHYLLGGIVLLAFVLTVWMYVVDAKEKVLLVAAAGRFRAGFARIK